ncbi:MAG: hypothetical protein QOH93_2426 [Chloroflexia bacterium]|jgi:hypothetical protein|nr:hypothetical protein [Chloroflexia bacterium]
MATVSRTGTEQDNGDAPAAPGLNGASANGDDDADAGKRSTSTLKQRGMKKYQIVVPESLFEEIEKIADSRQTTVIDIIRRFLKLGLLTARIENTPNAGLFIREGESEREIILL